MTTAQWPSDLPCQPTLGGFREQRQRNVVAFQPDVGAPKMRRRSTAAYTRTSLVFRMTTAHLETFEEFYIDTLEDGTLPFIWQHPRTLLYYNWVFEQGEAPQFDRSSTSTTTVSFTLLRLDETEAPPEPAAEPPGSPLAWWSTYDT